MLEERLKNYTERYENIQDEIKQAEADLRNLYVAKYKLEGTITELTTLIKIVDKQTAERNNNAKTDL